MKKIQHSGFFHGFSSSFYSVYRTDAHAVAAVQAVAGIDGAENSPADAARRANAQASLTANALVCPDAIAALLYIPAAKAEALTKRRKLGEIEVLSFAVIKVKYGERLAVFCGIDLCHIGILFKNLLKAFPIIKMLIE